MGEGMAFRLSLALACALLAASPAIAETVDVRAGRLIDPDTGRVSADQRIRIVDGKIASVSPWAEGAAAVARVIDWSALTVLPGLIDLHTHIADGSVQGSDPLDPFKQSEAATILKAVPAARTMLRSGF